MPVLLGAGEIAAWLGCSTETVYRLVRERHLPATRLGGSRSSYRFNADDVDRWITENAVTRNAA